MDKVIETNEDEIDLKIGGAKEDNPLLSNRDKKKKSNFLSSVIDGIFKLSIVVVVSIGTITLHNQFINVQANEVIIDTEAILTIKQLELMKNSYSDENPNAQITDMTADATLRDFSVLLTEYATQNNVKIYAKGLVWKKGGFKDETTNFLNFCKSKKFIQ